MLIRPFTLDCALRTISHVGDLAGVAAANDHQGRRGCVRYEARFLHRILHLPRCRENRERQNADYWGMSYFIIDYAHPALKFDQRDWLYECFNNVPPTLP